MQGKRVTPKLSALATWNFPERGKEQKKAWLRGAYRANDALGYKNSLTYMAGLVHNPFALLQEKRGSFYTVGAIKPFAEFKDLPSRGWGYKNGEVYMLANEQFNW